MNLTELQKAYLAGFFDGDGCVSIVKSHKPPYGHYHQLAVMFSQSSKPFLEHWQQITGVGKIYEQRGKSNIAHTRPHYIWRIPSNSGAELLAEIAPYLIIKRRQAALAAEFQATKRAKGGRLTQAEKANRERIYEELRALKHTGDL